MKKLLNISGVIALLVSCLFFSTTALAVEKKISAPFGLKWGMTYDDVLNKTGNIKLIGNEKNRVKEYLIKNESSLIDGMDMYSISIDDKYGLINVDALIYVDEDDDSKVVEKYNILKQALSSKYGEQYSEEYLWKNGTRGMLTLPECLNNEVCGKYLSLFHGDDSSSVMVMLSGTADNRSVTISLFYKSEFIEKIKQEEKKQNEIMIKEKSDALASSL
ncbi:hypothetical protein [Proteus mirabilis]|uniref:hypothetical protein n=2 Tax=Proteus mirabilis TaxID=584 RepID=UPI000C7DCB07|nr:hypothetical protein [Proteus mirabilis]EHZ8013225.1 hypothetical protein [Proteus mirabilis]EKV2708362.1 hypothetical protein [Proteus mirabilis]ELT8918451.1 hypothetical protein [Proteus mirabilis]EMA1121648.1 hypothetical protein [Proteus mirabilis]MBG2765503.1 hypothetical protein [Proteus mirabilis]